MSDLSFTLTFAYKTSTIAGSSFMYSMPVTSTGRGFPSVMSLVVGNKKQIAVSHLTGFSVSDVVSKGVLKHLN